VTPAADVNPDHRRLIQLLDEAPMRLPHYLAWAMSTGGTLLDGLSVFMLGIAMPLLAHDMALSAFRADLHLAVPRRRPRPHAGAAPKRRSAMSATAGRYVRIEVFT